MVLSSLVLTTLLMPQSRGHIIVIMIFLLTIYITYYTRLQVQYIITCVYSTDPPTLSDLIEHVGSSCSTKWYNLGLRLGVNTHTLDQIEEDCQRKTREACRKMFQAWLR